MTASQACKALIIKSESLKLIVYNDAGHPAIGYGHDLQPGEEYPNGITEDQAEYLLDADIGIAESHVSAAVPPSCTQGQFDALVDFTFEFGAGGLEELLAHGWDQVTTQLPRWCHVKNEQGVEVVSEGILARRQAEVAMFQS